MPIAYAFAISYPEFLLKEKYQYKNFIVRSDKVIPTEIEGLLDKVSLNLSRSELYKDDMTFNIYFCHSKNLFAFFTRNKNAGGVVNGIISANAFIREADILNNEIIPSNGWLLSRHDRPLSYFLAHELTHSLQSKYDRFMIVKTEPFIMEGYADYIAKRHRYQTHRCHHNHYQTSL